VRGRVGPGWHAAARPRPLALPFMLVPAPVSAPCVPWWPATSCWLRLALHACLPCVVAPCCRHVPTLNWLDKAQRQAVKHYSTATGQQIAALLWSWGEFGYTPNDKLFMNQLKVSAIDKLPMKQLKVSAVDKLFMKQLKVRAAWLAPAAFRDWSLQPA